MSLKKGMAVGITALMVLAAFAAVMGPALAQGDGVDVLRIAMQEDMPNFNNFDLSSNSVWKNYVLGKWVYDSLSGLDPGGNLFPQLAQNWTFDFANLTVYLTLRPGVKFHDGEDCTADDIVFTYMSIRSGTTYSANIINAFDADGDGDCVADEMDGTVDSNSDGTFEGITKLTDHSVKFVMAKPYGQFFLQTLGVPIIPEHIWSSHLDSDGIVDVTWTTGTDAQDAAIGTGPFYYHSGVKDVYRQLVKFEDHNGATYWGTDFVTPVGGYYIYPQEVDEIYFTLYSSLDTAILALQSGLVDHIPWTVTHGYVDDLLSNPRTDVTTVSDNGYFYLAFNMKKEPMNYLAFRQAVSHVIDKTTIVERYMGGFGQAGDSSEPPFWTDWYNTSVKHYEFSQAKAIQMLTAGGFTGVGTSLKMPNGKAAPSIVLLTPPADYDPVRIKAGELIAKNLRALGIDVVAKPVDFDTLVAKMNAFDFDMLIIGWSLTSDPIGNVFDILGPKASSNTFGFWSDSNPNPFYKDLLGVSTMADAQTQAYADLVQILGDRAAESFDRDEQIMNTKWAQGVLAEALPVNVLYYRVNNYATLDTWDNWINYLGELLNVYSIGTLTKGVVAPPSGEVIALLNLPDKLPSGRPTTGSVIVMTGQGEPIAGADVTLTGASFTPASGKTDVSGVFEFTTQSTTMGWITITAAATDGTTAADPVTKTVQVVPAVPNMVHLQVMPEKLFLAPGESTAVDLLVTDANGDGVEGILVELEEGLMGYGTISPSGPAEVTTDASGMASMTYTAPDPAPMNKHVEVRLSIAPKTEGTAFETQNVNTVTQFIVVKQPVPSTWHFAQIEGATLWATNNTTNTTTISVKTFNEGGNPTTETLEVAYSNSSLLWNPTMTVTTDVSGMGSVTLQFKGGIDTSATQVFFKNKEVLNAVGAGANVLYKGVTASEMYGGYFSITGVPMLDPDTDGNLTFDVYLYDIDGNMAMGDVPVAVVVGEPADGSTTAILDAPDYVYSSLWDYAGINIFTDADSGALAAGGYLLSELMTDAEIDALNENYVSWTDLADNWWTFPEVDNMVGVTITDGHGQISVARDNPALADNIPQLYIVPMAKAGFFVTSDDANYWWQIEGQTAWKTEFIMQRTNTIYSVKYDMEKGILRDFAPGNTSMVDVTVLDQDNNPVEGIGVSGSTAVYGGRPYFTYTDADMTNATGMTNFTATGMPATDTGTPLSTPAKQPMYIEASPDYGWSTFTSVEIFDVPVQLYLNLEVTPILVPSGEVTQADVTAMVVDANGDPVAGLDVEFTADEGSIDPSVTTDASGMGTVMFTIPEVPSGDNFIIAKIKSSVLKEGYGAASVEFNVVSGAFSNTAPVISDLSIAETGYETEATTWSITGKATDDYGVVLLTGSLDGANPVAMTMTGDSWSFDMSSLTVAAHTVVITVEDVWGLTATKTLTFTVKEPTVVNLPPVISGVNIPATGYKVNQGVKVTFTGKATDDLGIASVKYKLDNGTAVTVTLTGQDWTFELTGLSVGNHTVIINVTDNMGLFVTYTSTFEVKAVTTNTPPTITNVNIPATYKTKKATFTISGTVTDAEGLSKLEIKVDSGTPVVITPITGVNAWSYELKNLKVGDHTVTVTATDTFNETATFTSTITVEEEEAGTNWALWIGIIVIILIVVVLLAVMMMRKKPEAPK